MADWPPPGSALAEAVKREGAPPPPRPASIAQAAQPAQPVEPVAEPESLVKRSGRRAVQEVLSAPAIVGGVYGLAGAAIDKYRTGEAWSDAMLSEHGKKMIEDAENGSVVAANILSKHPEAVLRTGLSNAAEWYNWGGKIAGVTNNPDGSVPLDEEVGGVALSTLLTLPGSVVTKPAQAVGKITNTATRRALLAAGRIAEIATPVTVLSPGASVTRNGAIMGANLGVGIAMNDAARFMLDEPTLAGTLLPDDNDPRSVTGPGSVTPMTGLPMSDASGEASFDMLGAAGVLGAGGVMAGAALASPGRVASRIAAASKDARGTMNDALSNVATAWTDDSARLVREVTTKVGASEGEAFDDMLRTSTRHANESTYQRVDTLGLLGANGEIRVTPIQGTKRMYNDLSQRQRELFDIGMEARDELAHLARPGAKPRTSFTVTELRIRADAAKNDPQVNKLMQDYDKTIRGFNEWELKAGLIDSMTFNKRVARSGYVPKVDASKDTFTGKTRVWVRENVFDEPSSIARAPGRDGNAVTRMKPIDALEDFARRSTSTINEEQVRRRYLQLIERAPISSFPDGVRSVVRVKDAAHGKTLGGYKVTVRENGKTVEYRVADPRTARALQFQPHAVAPMNSAIRQFFQKNMTGNFNPLFAPTSLAYDATFGMLAADNQKVVTGVIDQALKRAGASVRLRQMLAGPTRIVDTPFLIMEGMALGAHGRYRHMIAERLAMTAARTGAPTSQAAATAAADAFMKSKYGLMHMSGYSANSFSDNMEKLTIIERSLPTRAMIGLLDTIRDAYRMGMFARNVSAAKMASPTGDIDRAMYDTITRHVREVASDPTKRGSMDTFNKIISSVPYGGVIMHSTAHLFAQMKNPAAYSTLVTVAAAKWYFENTLSDEAKQYVRTREPDYRRIGSLYIERKRAPDEPFDPAVHLERIPLGPELGTMTHVAMMLFGGMFNADDPTSLEPPMMDQAISAVGDLFGFSVPPMFNIAAAVMGKGPVDVGAALEGRELFRQPMVDGGIEEFRGTGMNAGYMTDRVYNMLVAAMGSTGRMIGDSAEIMDSAVQKYDEKFYEAAGRAAGAAFYEKVTRQAARYTLFDQAQLATPLGTHSSSRAYAIDQALDKVTQVVRNLNPTITEPMDADIPFSKQITEMPARIQDPLLRDQAILVSRYFGSPMHARQMDEIGQLRKSYRRMQGNTKVPIAAKNKALNEANDMMLDRYDTVLAEYGTFETMMKERFDDPKWTIDEFAKRVDYDLRGVKLPK